ncbi:MAG: hypothetical protein MJZ12_00805, partial [Prevotella sp.]|nr:hypothetical protein [Prevotella sp.]
QCVFLTLGEGTKDITIVLSNFFKHIVIALVKYSPVTGFICTYFDEGFKKYSSGISPIITNGFFCIYISSFACKDMKIIPIMQIALCKSHNFIQIYKYNIVD